MDIADLVDSDGLAVQANHVHHLDGILGVLFAQKLNESVALVRRRHSVLGHKHVHCNIAHGG